jgi:hypothetical protein
MTVEEAHEAVQALLARIDVADAEANSEKAEEDFVASNE